MDIVDKNIFDDYDAKSNIIKTKLADASYIKIENNENDVDMIYFYDGNDNIIYKSKFQYNGFYINNEKCWIWAWSIWSLSSTMTDISKKLLFYGLELKKTDLLKLFFITSRFKLPNKFHLDYLNAVCLNYTKFEGYMYELQQDIDDYYFNNYMRTKNIPTNKYMKINKNTDNKSPLMSTFIYLYPE